jgi:peptide deformylase
MTEPPADRAATAFADALAQLREERGLSKKQLAAEMGFDPSYVSHVEAKRHRPTEDFARRADTVLRASGVIWQLFREYDDARSASGGRHTGGGRRLGPPEQRQNLQAGLIVERELAELSFVGGRYRCLVRRALYNGGTEPVTRYLARVAVDRYPGDPERSNRYYRSHPLGWEELDLTARCAGEPMLIRPSHDRDSFKEVWLLFENSDGRFPLYPGQRTTIEYEYTVGEDKWGTWFQRAIRLPTERLAVRLDFPAALDPVVWGMESSFTADAVPLRTPITRRADGDRVIFDWATDNPPLNARYRLEWRFRGGVGAPSDRMRAAGVVQRGAPVLQSPARRFDLPDDQMLAEEVVERLRETLRRVFGLHDFSKGAGIAAPQVGINWAAAVVRPTETGEIVLLNPTVIGASPEHDEQYEGCLSFFDVRGLVARPIAIDVRHQLADGTWTVTRFERALARLVAHEVDHLDGVLYPDRMPPGAPLLPVEEYEGAGQPWRYGK